MRHQKVGRQLGRNASHRKAMYRNMVTSLFEHGKIQTTDSKAKELRKIADKLITIGKRGGLANRRRAAAYVRDRAVVAKLFDEIAPGFGERPGGYTRIVKLGYRRGDNAAVSIIELVTEPYQPKVKAKVAPEAPKAEVAAAPVVEQVAEEAPVAEESTAEEAPAEEETPAE